MLGRRKIALTHRPFLSSVRVCHAPPPRKVRRRCLPPTNITMASSSCKEAADAALKAPMPSIEWLQCIELGYEGAETKDTPVCFSCGKSNDGKLSKCAKCHVAGYCTRECQVKDWKTGPGGGHKHSCQGMCLRLVLSTLLLS